MTILTEGTDTYKGWSIERFENSVLLYHPEIAPEHITLARFENWTEGVQTAKQHIDRGNFFKADYGFFRVWQVSDFWMGEICTESCSDWQVLRFEDELQAIAWAKSELEKAAQAAWQVSLAEHLLEEGLISMDEYDEMIS